MAAANYAAALKRVLASEGGYSNHPEDPGGPTMKGVTQKVYDAYRERAGKARQSVRNISAAELQAIYRDQCSACHALDGKGVPQLFPSLIDSSLVRSSDPATLIRVVLRGARSVATAAEPTAPGMPSLGWQLDDAQVAAVLTYIRNAGDAAAAPVSTDDVSRARSALRGRTD